MEKEPTIWFYEDTGGIKLGLPVKDILFHKRSVYQDIYVMEIKGHGRALVLDDCIQLTEKDEFIYHELIVHPALFTHPHPQEVLVIGGGDGGSVREILKHKSVRHIDLVEIDAEVIEVAKTFFPTVSVGLKDSRVNIHIEDGIKYVKTTDKKYDIAIVDSTDPIGPAKALYEIEFHQDLGQRLNEDGIMIIQSECPYYNAQFIKDLCIRLRTIYPIVKIYVYAMPTYPGGMWSFIYASFKYEPTDVEEGKIKARWQTMTTRYYNPKVHKGVFYMLPQFMLEE